MNNLSGATWPFIFLLSLAAGSACKERPNTPAYSVEYKGTSTSSSADEGLKVVSNLDSADPLVLQTYARQLVSILAGRPLNADERKKLSDQGAEILPELIKAWVEDPFFARAFRSRIEILIGTSGKRDDIDFNLPGNLAEYIVKERLPIANLLTADFCVDSAGKKKDCDTGAPFSAGVLGTRGYLVAHSGRFNLGRANAMLGAFACKSYPMSEQLQPMMPKADLVENFRIQTIEEAQAKGSTGFGNGAACYTCHGQFSAHAQFFVKFDDKGLYRADANGIQSGKLEFGRSENGTFASHFVDPKRSADEAGNMFGSNRANLAEGMKALTENPVFLECIVKQVITHAFNLDSESSNKISIDVMKKLTADITPGKETVLDVYEAILTDPLLLKAFAKGMSHEE